MNPASKLAVQQSPVDRHSELSRRRFLGTFAATAAACSLPSWFIEECQGQQAAVANGHV